MSELKARTARSIADAEEMLELGADCPIEPAQVYLKSEADKVIAEKDTQIAELKKGAKNLILDNYLQDKELRHQKYKRCFAMAKLCHWKMGVFIYKKEKSDFYYRWYKRWLELAEKFKPNNSTAQ